MVTLIRAISTLTPVRESRARLCAIFVCRMGELAGELGRPTHLAMLNSNPADRNDGLEVIDLLAQRCAQQTKKRA